MRLLLVYIFQSLNWTKIKAMQPVLKKWNSSHWHYLYLCKLTCPDKAIGLIVIVCRKYTSKNIIFQFQMQHLKSKWTSNFKSKCIQNRSCASECNNLRGERRLRTVSVGISELSGSQLKAKTLVLVLVMCLWPIDSFKAMWVCRKCIWLYFLLILHFHSQSTKLEISERPMPQRI